VEQQDLKTYFLDKGYIVFDQLLDPSDVLAVEARHKHLIPNRGHGVDNAYWPQDRIKDCPELGLWWSQLVHDWPEVAKITEKLTSKVGHLFENPTLYIADIITNEPTNKFIKPHIDSPYRFDRWHENFDLLGVQFIVPLCPFSAENGGTGVLPNSHKRNWEVKECYRGTYNDEFLKGVVQPEMNIGDALAFNPRILHSTMPNNSARSRRALLIHITSQYMVDQVKLVDNVLNY
jgi:ectoine hydroxylase-related dioxygenase (phytanoyl-CoA dioxygenase family)